MQYDMFILHNNVTQHTAQQTQQCVWGVLQPTHSPTFTSSDPSNNTYWGSGLWMIVIVAVTTWWQVLDQDVFVKDFSAFIPTGTVASAGVVTK
jgi:hypothetical protein